MFCKFQSVFRAVLFTKGCGNVFNKEVPTHLFKKIIFFFIRFNQLISLKDGILLIFTLKDQVKFLQPALHVSQGCQYLYRALYST